MHTDVRLNPRCTVYSQEYRDELRTKFLEAFYLDPFPFAHKLKTIGISKACFSTIKNLKHNQNKIVLKKMKCYVDGVKYEPPPEGYRPCCTCEELTKIEDLDHWACRACRCYYNHKTPTARATRKRNQKKRNISYLAPGEFRENYLTTRRRVRYRREYGQLATCIELVNQIRGMYFENKTRKTKEVSSIGEGYFE